MTIMSESVLKTIPVPASGIDGFGIKFYFSKHTRSPVKQDNTQTAEETAD